MKAADYRIPWGRPSEHLLAVKREIIGQQLHVRRVQDARNRSTIDTDPPECAHMPHLITRPKKKKMQEDRQREIAAENYSLMHRLAGIMKEERGDPVQKFAHLSVEYRESLRRKKLLKLQTENRRLARSIRKQKPFYPNRIMEREEEERQALLKTMSRTERRKERVASMKAALSGRRNNTASNNSCADAATANTSLVEDGVLFRPGPTAVKLRTARQMQLEVARRRQAGGDGGDDHHDLFASGEGEENGDGGHGGGARGSLSSSTSTHALTVKRRAYSSEGAVTVAGRTGEFVLEVNRTGGDGGGGSRRRRRSCGGGGGGGGGNRRSETGAGRPNMIFTPSLAPVGMESVRACPMSLGGAHAGRKQMAGDPADPSGSDVPGGVGRESEGEISRDVQTV